MSEHHTMTDSNSENTVPAGGQAPFRSLRELAREELFEARLQNEFPLYAPSEADGVTRRNFMQVMGATLALGGLASGCARQPAETILPYVKAPEDIVPGKPLFFATANIQGGYAKPVLAESHMGRPTKIEGLPGHPASLGRTDAQTQASVLDLYDPDRAQAVTRAGMAAQWDTFVKEARQILDDTRPAGGDGVRILTGTVTSPTLAGMLNDLLAAYPKAVWHQYEPAGRDNVREGARIAFGEYVDTLYRLDQADVIVSLDADFLDRGPANVRYTADYAQRRDVVDAEHGEQKLNRLYAFESSPSNTGAAADHKFVFRPSQIEAVARRLATALGVPAGTSDQDGLAEADRNTIAKIAADLKNHTGASIVIAGDHQPAAVHALAHAMNDALGSVGKTVNYIQSVEANPANQMESLRQLTSDMRDKKVRMLLIFGGNPVYNAPADLDFLAAMKNVPLRVFVGAYLDETGEQCHWHIPAAHYLETWGDARAFDGTVSLIQPLIAPLYGGRSPLELLSALIDKEPRSAHDVLQAFWKKQQGEANFDAFWRTSLSEGFVANTAYRPYPAKVKGGVAGEYAPAVLGTGEFEVAILPDPAIGDGTWSNNAWLMELPRPLSKVTWDNCVYVGYSTALDFGVEDEDLVEVTYNNVKVRGPICVQPGHAPQTVTLHLGYGRTRAGDVSNGIGFNVYPVMNSAAPAIGRGATIKKLAGKYPLARTEEHFNMENRHLVRHVTAAAFAAEPHAVQHGTPAEPIHTPSDEETLYDFEEKQWSGNAWGMTIDLNKCTGCNACITACQSENIIPVVGKFEVRKGREMLWIRLDRYYDTGAEHDFKKLPKAEQSRRLDNPKVYYQPVPCMQCENAPCETVCPVGATQHSKEGLNDMVYNRCVGTRYCSNNCPYKVRRFNFYHYSRTPLGSRGDRVFVIGTTPTHIKPESLRLMRNPDVTVRTRGVMEKCTYCVQRINLARIDSKKTGKPIQDSDCVTACQQACPAGAIVFGNIHNPESDVSRKKASHRNYSILADLNTRPRTTYLARVTNPNPELAQAEPTEPKA
jgi:molybdopterin-containing oxidoreductase family iron-sulfur binding subunit